MLLVFIIYAGQPALLMGTRVAQMNDIVRGPGGLVACPANGIIPPDFTEVSPGCYRGALGDDPLMFIVVPAVSRATGLAVTEIMKWSAIVSLAAVMFLLPFLLGHAWPLAPLILLADPLRSVDLYWFAPVTYIAIFPLLLTWQWDRRWLILLALIAGVLSSFRSGTGLPVLLGALVAGWRRPRPAALIWAGAVIVAYLVPGWLLPTTARFWHSIYIGLGYLPNPWVAGYRDDVGIATAARLAPGTVYQSPAYDAVLRAETIRIALADPGFIVRTVLAKLDAVGPAVLAVATLLAAALPFAFGRRGLIFAPALALAVAPAILTVPDPAYLTGFYVLIALGLIAYAPRMLDVLRIGLAPRSALVQRGG